MKTAGPLHRSTRLSCSGPFVSLIFSGPPDDHSDVLAVDRPRDVLLLEAVDDLDRVDHLAVLNDLQTNTGDQRKSIAIAMKMEYLNSVLSKLHRDPIHTS